MNSRTLVAVVGVLVLAVPTDQTSAQWERFNTPSPLHTTDIESQGGYLFASTDEGVYRSDDDGSSWEAANTGLPMDTFFFDLLTIGNVVFALTERHDKWRVLRSTDEGKSWVYASNELEDELHSLAAIGERLFVVSEERVYRSVDFGDSWQSIGGESLDSCVDFIAVSGRDIFAVTWDGVYRSEDFGESWTLVTTDLGASESWIEAKKCVPDDVGILSLIAIEDMLFASAIVSEEVHERALGGGSYSCNGCADFEALFRSSDNGSSWTLLSWEPVSDDKWDTAIQNVVSNGDEIFASTWRGVFRSINNGINWRLVNSGLPAEEKDQVLPLVGTLTTTGDTLVAGTWNGVYVSTDNGDSWVAANTGLPENTFVRSFAASSHGLFASLGAHGIYLSRDQGRSWTAAGSGSEVIAVDAIKPIGNDLFAETAQGLYRSTDNGDSWSAIKPITRLRNETSVPVWANDSDLFLAASNRIYRSTNGGRSWIDTHAPASWGIGPLVVDGDLVVVTAYEQGLYRSTNGGKNWVQLDDGMGPKSIWYYAYLTKVDENLFASDSQAGVLMSTDNGDSWIAVNAGLPAPPFRNASPDRGSPVLFANPVLSAVGSHLFVATEEGIFLFDPEEAFWTSVNAGLPEDALVRIDASSADLFAHTVDMGTWRLRMRQLPRTTQ